MRLHAFQSSLIRQIPRLRIQQIHLILLTIQLMIQSIEQHTHTESATAQSYKQLRNLRVTNQGRESFTKRISKCISE